MFGVSYKDSYWVVFQDIIVEKLHCIFRGLHISLDSGISRGSSFGPFLFLGIKLWLHALLNDHQFLSLCVILFAVNMRIVGTDENLKPLTGKVRNSYPVAITYR